MAAFLPIWQYCTCITGLQRDVVYLDWPIAPNSCPNAGGGPGQQGLRQWVQLCTGSPNKLWRSRGNSIFNLHVRMYTSNLVPYCPRHSRCTLGINNVINYSRTAGLADDANSFHSVAVVHRLNMELDILSLFAWAPCAVHYCNHWLRPRKPPPPPAGAHIRGHYWSAMIDDISLGPPATACWCPSAVPLKARHLVLAIFLYCTSFEYK